jgi:hypothetical protein
MEEMKRRMDERQKNRGQSPNMNAKLKLGG